ncbi:chemotaxis protein CheB [Chitinophaga pinensis]|uniref:protein-glutamate methylesterase n=1 Tax=Chitinophaga pinensis (strain ATCC 43595 / DSM 2588 / LMG 13176 / NBRC 15968 / NCIMB 11800 / UQM 2034) TaxID=485918 RepID=A0A979GQW6_CHIPD|nr:chemotaxis protein CheB [Chitinophaga pinensis]ACU61867.1 CheB methylesterase [Chitinophaga pinensis DSM 2588]
MNNRKIVVIGASAGGFEAIKKIVSDLPANFDAAIFIVWHMAAEVRGILPEVLNKLGTLPVAHAVDEESVIGRRIYIAPPDRHLLLGKGKVRVTRGPKENRFRPAIDPLFRSAAIAYGTQVIGVVLSGALDDGTAGIWAVKQQGGLAIVQDPDDAEVSSMPVNAMNAVKVDHIAPVSEIAALLVRLANEEIPSLNGRNAEFVTTAQQEVGIAMKDENISREVFRHGELTPYTCPECHGVLSSLTEGDRIRFRCHTGHAFSADTLLSAITESIEEALWNAIRNIQESTLLLNHMGDHFAEANQAKIAAMYFKKAKDAMKRGEMVRKAVFDHEQLSMDSVKDQADTENVA